MTPGIDHQLDRVYRVTAIVSVAMVVSAVFYAGIVEILSRSLPSGEPVAERETIDLLRQIFHGLALVQFLVLVWLRGRSGRADGEPLARLARLRTLTMIRLALAESIAIYGLVLFFMSRDTSDFYYLFLVSLLSFVLAFPRRDRWKEALRDAVRRGPGPPVSTE